ncbi:MAG: hypothetical protein P1P84_03155 [Deferrisomatales bacterium]|nr:hypothetical protein [Deferrisomatales bacterium]
MTPCRHPELVLGRARPRWRCRHCGLTITVEELGDGPCPECLAHRGEHCRDFEETGNAGGAARAYRCAACGARIDWE